MSKTKILALTQAVLLLCISSSMAQQQTSSDYPAILPGQYSLGLRFEGGHVSIVQTSSPDESERWDNPLSEYFLYKEHHKGLELTDEQKRRISELNRVRTKHMNLIADNAHRYLKQSIGENGQIDVEKYKSLLQENKRIDIQHNAEIEKALNEFILPHQWKYMANAIARDTIRSEGLANHLGNPALTKFLKVNDEQQEAITADAAKIVAEYDRDFAEMSKSAVKRLLSNLNAKQKRQLKELIGEDDLTSLHDVNVVILVEQLRQVAKRKSAKSGNK